MPDRDTPTEEIEAQKLDFEREKLALEDKWRHKTWLWTIGSAILTAIVTVTVAWISIPPRSNGDKQDTASVASSVTLNAVRSCYDSLQRLQTLSNVVREQTGSNLQAAIQRHHDTCDELFLDLIEERSE